MSGQAPVSCTHLGFRAIWVWGLGFSGVEAEQGLGVLGLGAGILKKAMGSYNDPRTVPHTSPDIQVEYHLSWAIVGNSFLF